MNVGFFARLFALLILASGGLAATIAQRDAERVAMFVALVGQAPALGLPREATRDGILTPLSKTTTRADGITLGVVADSIALATEHRVRSQFANFADRFLALALLQLPRRDLQSPDAAGLVEYRLSGTDGVMFLLAWRSDQPFASHPVPALADACALLLPPFDAGSAPHNAAPGLSRRQVLSRSHAGHQYQRSSSWRLEQRESARRWVLTEDQCKQQS